MQNSPFYDAIIKLSVTFFIVIFAREKSYFILLLSQLIGLVFIDDKN